MKTINKFILSLLVLCISLNSFSQGKIDESKEELKKKYESIDDTNNDQSSASSGDAETNNILAEAVVKVFLYITYYGFIGNYADEDHLHSNLTRYPYYNKISGNYESDDDDPPLPKPMRLDVEDKLLYSPLNLYGNHLKVKLRPFQFFYLQTDYFQFMEYNTLHQNYSNLSLFNFNFCYDRIRLEQFNLGWTLGVNYVGNGINKAGISFGFNIDIFPINPFSIYSSIKWGAINRAPVNEFEVQCKYHRNNHFYSLGYEHLKIGRPNYDFISIGGGIYF